MLMSVGFGMIFGLAMWVVGIWGKSASLADAALPPPYTKEFFAARLREWVMSLQPLIVGPLVIIAIVSTIMMARRERRPAHTYDQAAIWWLLPFLGTLTVLTATVVPYYRFMNATAAPMALAGLGSFVAIRWFLRLEGPRRIAGVLGVVVILGSIGWVLNDGLTNRWVSERNQWANQGVRSSLAAVHEVVADAGTRPSVRRRPGARRRRGIARRRARIAARGRADAAPGRGCRRRAVRARPRRGDRRASTWSRARRP